MNARSWSVLCALLVVLAFPVGTSRVFAAEVHVQSDTLVRVFERDTVSGTDQLVVPGYEYLQLDLGALQERGLSFHFYGWGRADLGDSDYYSDQTAGEILYGYLEYAQPSSTLVARLGRQHIFAGVANETVDGLWLSSALGQGLSASLYAGQPAGLDSANGRDGDSIYGGRLACSGRYHRVGLSYKRIENDNDTAEQMAGIDYALDLPGGAGLYGNSTYNLETEDFAEHSLEARVRLSEIDLRPFFSLYQYEDYFGTGANASNPFRGLAQSGDELLVYGIDATWRRTATWGYGGKARIYDSDQRDSSSYLSLLTTWYGETTNQVGGEIGYLFGDGTGNDFLLLRLYGYWDALPSGMPFSFLSADLLVTLYDETINGEDASAFVSLGCGWALRENLALKASADYSQDAYFDNDLRGLVSLSYRFDQSL
jgi:hypothetical protein